MIACVLKNVFSNIKLFIVISHVQMCIKHTPRYCWQQTQR